MIYAEILSGITRRILEIQCERCGIRMIEMWDKDHGVYDPIDFEKEPGYIQSVIEQILEDDLCADCLYEIGKVLFY